MSVTSHFHQHSEGRNTAPSVYKASGSHWVQILEH